MRHVLLVTTIALLFPTFSLLAEGLNAGFVQGLWYSHEPVFADEKVRIYVALRNNAESDITATVRFTDNDDVISEKKIEALSGRLLETWVDWTPSFGQHELSASLMDIVLDNPDGETATGTVSYALAKDTLFVDYDTDEDGIGNETDEDDDNDGVTDKEEIGNGTDPLVYDEPEDDEDTTGDDSATSSGDDVAEDSEDPKDTNNPQGLEQFFSDGTIKNVLASITSTTNYLKTGIDAYRRGDEHENTSAQYIEEDEVEEDDIVGLTIIATTSQDNDDTDKSTSTNGEQTEEPATITISKIEGFDENSGILATIGSIVKTVASALYAFILWFISFYLSYPALVQLTLLFLILFIIYKFARRLGRRPGN